MPSATLPTLDELRTRRRAATRALNARLLPAILAVAVVELVLLAAILLQRHALAARGQLLPLLIGVAVAMAAVMLWIVVRWRPSLAAEEVARHALACPRCGGPVLFTPLSTTRDLRSGRPTAYGPRIEDRCTRCGAALVRDGEEPGRYA